MTEEEYRLASDKANLILAKYALRECFNLGKTDKINIALKNVSEALDECFSAIELAEPKTQIGSEDVT